MFGRILLLCTIVVFSGFANAQESAGKKKLTRDHRLRIASWNMLNLFDNYDEPGKPDEGTAPKSRAEMAFLAKAIDELDADILGVQEVENRAVLEALNSYLKRPYLFVELIEGNDARGIDVGLLSRLPVVRAASHRQLDLEKGHRFARDFPLFRVQIAKGEFVEVGVVHLKSKRGGKESDAWRRAEAEGIRRIVSHQRKIEPQVPVVIMGDFNDNREAATLEPVFATFNDPTMLVPEDQRYSFTYRGKREQIDFILSSGMTAASKAYFLQRADSPSDHSPVIVDFEAKSKIVRPDVPASTGKTQPKRPRVKGNDLVAAKRHLLREVTVEGVVAKVHRYRGGAAVLNFDKNHKEAIAVYIPRDALERFKNLDDVVGKKVQVDGPVSKHRGDFQVVMTRASQLRVETKKP